MIAQEKIEKKCNNVVIMKSFAHYLFLSFPPISYCWQYAREECYACCEAAQVPYFWKSSFSISDVTKETLHGEELAKRAEGNEKFKLKKLNVDGFDAELYFDVKDMQNITLGDIINLVDQVQANDKKIEASFRFER